ncbi:MAG: hypothetical protein AB7E42_05525 [Anaerotignaceae bacterium]
MLTRSNKGDSSGRKTKETSYKFIRADGVKPLMQLKRFGLFIKNVKEGK